ncbi:unnamed protein product [Vicia faba]|uniref:Uncharacterized protein n=1 Tax=Vicia faba TaxID=3906 RepID=A0AAV1BDY0_VICFA|nr:unnamed protein product [Vicia faba]
MKIPQEVLSETTASSVVNLHLLGTQSSIRCYLHLNYHLNQNHHQSLKQEQICITILERIIIFASVLENCNVITVLFTNIVINLHHPATASQNNSQYQRLKDRAEE